VFVKEFPACLLVGLGIMSDDTDELESIFEDHDIYATVREVPAASSKFWIFELGAIGEDGEMAIRSTPFLPIGNTVDDAARQAELMITYQGKNWRGEIRTGQLWTEHVEFGEIPQTKTTMGPESLSEMREN
jgi:hypothetical protein